MDDIQGDEPYAGGYATEAVYPVEAPREYATKADLLANPVTEDTEEYTLPNGKVLLIRGLSRFEFLLGQKMYPDDQIKQERWNASKAIINPQLTESDIEEWQKASGPMMLNNVSHVINKLSGIARGSDKEAYKSSGE